VPSAPRQAETDVPVGERIVTQIKHVLAKIG
jgi:hypothetical protein